jgi:DMSO/TMAO reductase YedYZ molybdopterin-dependent catalytic subunit
MPQRPRVSPDTRGARRFPSGAVGRAGGLADGVVELVFSGLDRGIEGGVEQVYERSLPVAEALGPDALLRYAMNGAPIPPQHGFPLRLVVAGWYGMAHVKRLGAVTAVIDPLTGFQQAVGYRYSTPTARPASR